MAEFHTLVDDVLGSTAGLVVLGDAHDTATIKADVSLATLGMNTPTTLTLREANAGIAPGLYDVVVASEKE